MLKMSIRRKLFLAFALVAAISSAGPLLLAGSAFGLVGCAHSTWSPSYPPPPSGVTVSLNENGHPPSDGVVGIYEVCIDATGTVQSVRVVQAMIGHPGFEESLRKDKHDPKQTRPCFEVRSYCDDCSAKAAATTKPPADAPSSAKSDAEVPAPATPSFKNISPMSFDDQRVVSPVPRLPDDFKVHHVGERLIFVAKICAASDGRIAQVSIAQGIPGADDAIVGTIRQWRLRPQPTGQGVCTVSRLVYDIRAR